MPYQKCDYKGTIVMTKSNVDHNMENNVKNADDEQIKPVFKGGKYVGSKFFGFFIASIFILEIMGHNMNIDIMMPSYMISEFGKLLLSLSSEFGYLIGCMSDVVKFFDNILTFLKDVVWVYTKRMWSVLLWEPLIRIFGASFTAISVNFDAFYTSFSNVLQDAYNKYFAYFMGFILTSATILFSLLLCETCGRKNKFQILRPSFVLVNFVANGMYTLFLQLSSSLGHVLNCLINIVTIVKKILIKIMPWLKDFDKSFIYICFAICDTFEGPTYGIVTGFKYIYNKYGYTVFLLTKFFISMYVMYNYIYKTFSLHVIFFCLGLYFIVDHIISNVFKLKINLS